MVVGALSAFAHERRLSSIRQITLLACVLCVANRNEEAKCKVIPETKVESLL